MIILSVEQSERNILFDREFNKKNEIGECVHFNLYLSSTNAEIGIIFKKTVIGLDSFLQ